jgi:hypothetical protein
MDAPLAVLGRRCFVNGCAGASFFCVMHYEGVEYVVRASLGRDEWTILIYFPDKAPDSNPTVVKFSGSRDAAAAVARRRIDNWITRQQRQTRPR